MSNRLFAAALAALIAGAPALALEAPAGMTVLTVAGEVEQANRAPVQDGDQGMLAFSELFFEKGVAFDRAMLAALEAGRIEAARPGSEETAAFEGPTLAALLEAVEATGDVLVPTAFDGYSARISREEIEAHDPILALTVDGAPLGIGDFGPAMIVFPADAVDAEGRDFRSKQVWGVFYIGVESE